VCVYILYCRIPERAAFLDKVQRLCKKPAARVRAYQHRAFANTLYGVCPVLSLCVFVCVCLCVFVCVSLCIEYVCVCVCEFVY